MNNILKFSLIVFVFFVTGCNDKYKTCNMSITNNSQEYTLNSNYKIYYKGKYVTKIVKKDNYVTENKSTLKYLNEYKKLELEDFNTIYGGLNYEIILDDDSLKIESIIDCNETDIDKMKLNDYIEYDYISSNRLTLTGAKYFYEAKGLNCDI